MLALKADPARGAAYAALSEPRQAVTIEAIIDNDPAKDVPTAGIEALAQRIMALP